MFALVALSVQNESFLDRHKKVFLCSVRCCCCCCWRHFSPATTLLKANKTNFNKSTHRAWLSKGAESRLHSSTSLLPNPFVVQPVLVVALQTLHTVCAFFCVATWGREKAQLASAMTQYVYAPAAAWLGMQMGRMGNNYGLPSGRIRNAANGKKISKRCETTLPAVQCTPS